MLALRSGIPVREWLREDDRVVATALDVLAEQDAESRRAAGGGAGAQMSG